MSSKRQKHLIIVSGPTAVGKTNFCIELAKHFKAEIISCDSRQFYREIKIGTAAPTREEMAQVKHHLVGNLSIHDYYNVSKFEQDVLQLLDQLFEKSDYVLMTGGSGLYISTITQGIDDLPDADEELRTSLNKKYEEEGLPYLQAELKRLDPEFYDIVDLKNPKRLLRAVEVCLATGKTYTELRKSPAKQRDFNIINIGLIRSREELFANINTRVDAMMNQGLLEEVKSMLPNRHLNALNTVGYKELFTYLDGDFTLEEAVEKIKTNTRRYAKRQITWFKKYFDCQWFNPIDFPDVIKHIEEESEK